MKPTAHFISTGTQCTELKVTVTITRAHLIAATAMLYDDRIAPTKALVLKQIRKSIADAGITRLDYASDHVCGNWDELEAQARATVARLFPDWKVT